MPKSRKIRPSSTAGKAKGANCHRSQMKNLFANDTRLHKTNPKLWGKAVQEVQRFHPTNMMQETVQLKSQ